MSDIKIIEVKESVFASNDEDAARLREELKQKKTYLLNIMASPGAGKTSILTRIVPYLQQHFKVGIMEADIDSDVDAKKMNELGVDTIQIHTGGMCHLDADMTRQGLHTIEFENYDLVILENVGNLVCPAEFDTGAVHNITILSVPEGDDKPLKYPLMYQTCQLLIINKIDVLDYFDFDTQKVVQYAKGRNPDLDICFASAKTSDGIEQIVNWIVDHVHQWIK